MPLSTLPVQQAPLISPGDGDLGQSCQVALRSGSHGGHAGQRLPSPFRHTQVTYRVFESFEDNAA